MIKGQGASLMITCQRCGSSTGDVRCYLDYAQTIKHATLDDCIAALKVDYQTAQLLLQRSPRVTVDLAGQQTIMALVDEVARMQREQETREADSVTVAHLTSEVSRLRLSEQRAWSAAAQARVDGAVHLVELTSELQDMINRLETRWRRAKALCGRPSAPPAWANPLADAMLALETDEGRDD